MSTLQIERGIGAPVKRKEDLRFITGTGRYTDDFNLRDRSSRSFSAHLMPGAALTASTCRRAGTPGVLRVLTGQDMAGGRAGRSALWLAGQTERRLGHGLRAASAAGSTRGQLCGRTLWPGDCGHSARRSQASASGGDEFTELDAVVDLGSAQSEQIHEGCQRNLATTGNWG